MRSYLASVFMALTRSLSVGWSYVVALLCTLKNIPDTESKDKNYKKGFGLYPEPPELSNLYKFNQVFFFICYVFETKIFEETSTLVALPS